MCNPKQILTGCCNHGKREPVNIDISLCFLEISGKRLEKKIDDKLLCCVLLYLYSTSKGLTNLRLFNVPPFHFPLPHPSNPTTPQKVSLPNTSFRFVIYHHYHHDDDHVYSAKRPLGFALDGTGPGRAEASPKGLP